MRIYLYYTFSNARIKQLKERLTRLGFEVESLFIVPGRFMPRAHFMDILRHIDDIEDMFAMRSKRMTNEFYERLSNLSLSQLYEYAVQDPKIFRDTIIYLPGDPSKVVFGGDKHELSVLHDRKTRRQQMLT